MTSYTKLFSSLLTSTIWAESDQTRIVWVTMLAMADQHGEVHSTVPGLARIAGVPLSEVEAALAKFTGPDPYSRTKDNDGRRIAEIDGGWELLNHAKYRAMASREDSKAQAADRQRRKRERDESRSVTPCHAPSRSVTDSHASVTQSLHIAEAEAEAEAKKDVAASPWLVKFGLELPESLRTQPCLDAVNLWLTHKTEIRDAYKATGLRMAMAKWANEFTPAEFPGMVEESVARGWKGIFRTKEQVQPNTKPQPAKPHPHQKLADELRAKLENHPADIQRVLDTGRQPTQDESREYSQLRDHLAALLMDNGGGK